MSPTIVLVHGAFAESASWDRVIRSLEGPGHDVIAAANPLRGVDTDAKAVTVITNVDADVPAPKAARMAATQRPVTLEALDEPSGDRPLWKQVPSWFVVAAQDRNIPADLQRFMADRAGARRTVELPTASHAAAVSHPEETARLILEAAAPLRAAA